MNANTLPSERIFDYIKKDDNDCWVWQRHRNSWGYGVVSLSKRVKERTHRLAYELRIGPIPRDKIVLHRCGNPACINPAHLYAGTWKDNAADRARMGRHRTPFPLKR